MNKFLIKIICLFPLNKDLVGIRESDGMITFPEGVLNNDENLTAAAKRIFFNKLRIDTGKNDWRLFKDEMKEDCLMVYLKYNGSINKIEKNKAHLLGEELVLVHHGEKNLSEFINKDIISEFFVSNGYSYNIKNNGLI